MSPTTKIKVGIFLTDYASYNEGTQFEFGHWVDLSDFSDANEFEKYSNNHFNEADKSRPLSCGTPREERMITDYEGLPSSLYSECMNFNEIFDYLNLDEDRKEAYEFLRDQGFDHSDAMDKNEDISFWPYESDNDIYWIFEQYYPEAEESSNSCDYLRIDYDAFRRNEFTEFTSIFGNTYLISDGSY